MQIVLNASEIAQAIVNFIEERYNHNVQSKLNFVVKGTPVDAPEISVICDVIDDE